MEDLISRQAAIDAVNELTYPSSLVDVKRKLLQLPSADRPSGEWINIDTKLFRVQCSACRVWSDVVGNYCPWCGAKMVKIGW